MTKMIKIDPAAPHVVQDDLLGLLGYNLKRSFMLLYTDFRATLDTMGVTQRTFSVLSIIIGNPDISQSDVARALGIERSGTVLIVDALEERGYVARNRVPDDRRTYALRATAQGQQAYKKALAAVRAHEDRIFADLTGSERELLRGLLGRVHHLCGGD